MPTKQKATSLGMEFQLTVPESAEEFDTGPRSSNLVPAGKAGECLAQAIRAIVAWDVNASFRYYFLHGIGQDDLDKDKDHVLFAEGTSPVAGVEELSKIERMTVPVKDKAGNPVVKDGEPVTNFDPNDSEAKYFKRVLAETKTEAASYQHVADAVAASLVFNAAPTERAAVGPKKLAAKYKEKAAAVIANGTTDTFIQSKFIPVVGRTPTFTLTNDQTKTFSVTWKSGDATKNATVSDKDAEALGWLVKEYSDAIAAQATGSLV
jgi:hypothetical protein